MPGMLREMGSKPKTPAPAPPPPVPKTADAQQAGSDAVAAAAQNSSYLDSFLAGPRKKLGGGGNSFLGNSQP